MLARLIPYEFVFLVSLFQLVPDFETSDFPDLLNSHLLSKQSGPIAKSWLGFLVKYKKYFGVVLVNK